jgi:hypothetical protein
MLIGATLNLRADQPEDSLDGIFSSGDLMDLLKYAEQHKDPADQQIIFKRLKGKIDMGQTADRFIPALLALSARNYPQLQEKVQALRAAVESYRANGPPSGNLKRYERSLELFEVSLELWRHELGRTTTPREF